DGELPARRPAHREPAGHEPVLVEPVVLSRVLQTLQRVDLAGELVRVAVPAVGVQDERARRRDDAAGGLLRADEVDLRAQLAAAVPPEVEPVLRLAPEVVARRDEQTVRLHRAVDPRPVAADDVPGRAGPRRLALLQLLRTLEPLGQELLRRGYVVAVLVGV